MKYEGRIVLDSFDHGIRDFPGILPMCLSSELAGHDIMHYMRQDKNISLYDMIGLSLSRRHDLIFVERLLTMCSSATKWLP